MIHLNLAPTTKISFNFLALPDSIAEKSVYIEDVLISILQLNTVHITHKILDLSNLAHFCRGYRNDTCNDKTKAKKV